MAMATEAHFEHGNKLNIDYTPVSDVDAGQVVDMGGGLVGVSVRAIKAGEQDALDIGGGVYTARKGDGVTFARGAVVYWDKSGKTTVAAPGGSTVPLGTCVRDAESGDDRVWVALNVISETAWPIGRIELLRIGGASDSDSGLLMGVGTAAAPAATSEAGASLAEIYGRTTATEGDNRLWHAEYEIAGAGASGECLYAGASLTAAAVSASGSTATLQVGGAGSVSGVGVGGDAALLVRDDAVAAGGAYYAGRSEIQFAGPSSSLAAVTDHAIHRFAATGNGTGKATCTVVWDIAATAAVGVAAAISSTKLNELPTDTVGIAVIINGNRYYIPAVLASEWN